MARLGSRRQFGEFRAVIREGDKFRARIYVGGAIEPLGLFDSWREAEAAVKAARAQRARPEFDRYGDKDDPAARWLKGKR